MNPRIIAGTAKNKKLQVPSSARPVTDRIKQSIFDLISVFIDNSKTLDLFAGSGSFGIEALSRGAAECTFVESDERAAGLIKENLTKTSLGDKATVRNQQVESFIHSTELKYDLIFCDPPFAIAGKFKLESLAGILSTNGIAVFRAPTPAEIVIPHTLQLAYTQKYGESTVYFLRLA